MKVRTTEEMRVYQRARRARLKLGEPPVSFKLDVMPGILPFQREWLGKAFAADIDLAALSAARGSGKSTLAGWIVAATVAPMGAVHDPGRGDPRCRADTIPGPRGSASRAWVPGRRARSTLARFGVGYRCAPSADGF